MDESYSRENESRAEKYGPYSHWKTFLRSSDERRIYYIKLQNEGVFGTDELV